MSNTIKSKKFTIVLMDKTFESNEDGFLDLNEIWRGCNLPNTKRPSQWRGKNKDYFLRCANLHISEINKLDSTTLGDETGSVAYAMWVSAEFYSVVVSSFVALRNGELAKAYDIAQSTVNETAESAFEKWLSYSDTPLRDACGMLGIKRTMLFMSEAKKPNQLKSFIDRGILKHRNYGDKGSAIRVTSDGKHFIKDNIDKINDKLEEIYNERNF